MKWLLLFVAFVLCTVCIVGNAQADYTETLTFSWGYDATNVPDLAGFEIMQDGQVIVGIAELLPTTRTITKSVMVTGRNQTYSVVAVDGGGNRSDPFSSDLDPPPHGGFTSFDVSN